MTAAATHPSARAHWQDRRAAIARAAFAPKSPLSLSQWADRFRILSADLGEPGPWRTSRVPYLREPMDAITDPRIREVVIQKPARVGATQGVCLNTIGYYVHQEPTAILMAFPTEGDAKKFSKQLLSPAIEDSPVLLERLAGSSRDPDNTILSKSFPGGGLQLVGTTSERNMRMVHGRIVLLTEVDSFVASSDGTGDPVLMLKKRADSYGAPKFVLESTPLIKGISRIEKARALTDDRRYWVPCPHCGAWQILEWGGRDAKHGIRWDRDPDTGKPVYDSAYYLCNSGNGCVVDESAKYWMIARGEWRPENPAADPSRRGYQFNALVSPFPGARWARLVELWYEAKGKPELLQVFVNQVLGETFEDEGSRVDDGLLANRQEDYERGVVPRRAGLLVRTVDTQGDRVETDVWAFGEGEEAWLVDVEVIPGDPAIPFGAAGSPWTELDKRIGTAYRHEGGASLTPAVTFIDSGGSASKEVYSFTKPRLARGVFAIKGANTGRGTPILSRPQRNNAAKAIMYMVGSFTLKETVLKRFAMVKGHGAGYIHLPLWLDDEHRKQYTNEKLMRKIDGGRIFEKWIQTGPCERFHLLCYALAGIHQQPGRARQLAAIVVAAQSEGARRQQAAAAVHDPDAPPQRAAPPRRGSDWVNRWKR